MKVALKYPKPRKLKMKLRRFLDRNNIPFERVTLICDIEAKLIPEIRAMGAEILNLQQEGYIEFSDDRTDIDNCCIIAAKRAVMEDLLLNDPNTLSLKRFSDDTILSVLKQDIEQTTRNWKEKSINFGNYLIELIYDRTCHRFQVLVYELKRRGSDKLLKDTFSL